MKKIVEYKEYTTDYSVGDVVYLDSKKGKPTCRAMAIKNDNEGWLFKPLSCQSFYLTHDGLIPFCGKPYIYAKELDIEEDQP